jgi:hypothetical protein
MSTNPYQPPKTGTAPPVEPTPVPPTPLVWKLVRSVLGILAGIVAGVVVVLLIEIPAWILHPVPPEIDLSDAEALKAHATNAPFAAQLCVAIAWVAGPLIGSFVAAAIARWASFGHGMTITAVFLAFVVMSVRTFPHPGWMVLVGVIGPLAAGWIGSSLAERLFALRPANPRPDPRPHDMRKKNMAC